jgi:hypothetical protein
VRSSLRLAPLLSGVALLFALPITPGAVVATQGVALDTGRIIVPETLTAGERYTLPPITLSNPGSERCAYALSIGRAGDESGLEPLAGWFRFAPQTVRLRPGHAREVRITIMLPVDVQVGRYEAVIQAVIGGTGNGTSVSAAAATRLEFTVAGAGSASGDQMSSGPMLPVVILAVGAAAAAALLGRYRLRIDVRR